MSNVYSPLITIFFYSITQWKHGIGDHSRFWWSLWFTSSLAKGYDPLYSSSPLASLDGFSRSHGDGLYVMQLVVTATNQNALYTSRLRANKDIFSVYNSHYRFALIVCQWFYIKFFTNLRLKISHIIISSQFSGHSSERKWKPCFDWLKMTSLQGE